jgi:hypothetical protein
VDVRRFDDVRGTANITLKAPIDWYFEEIVATHPFVMTRKIYQRQGDDQEVLLLSKPYDTASDAKN